MIANTGNMGIPGTKVNLAPNSDVSDGLLDVVVYSHSKKSVWMNILTFNVARSEAEIKEDIEDFKLRYHWQAKKIRIETDPPMKINLDGEIIGETPSEIEVVPQAVSVLTPD